MKSRQESMKHELEGLQKQPELGTTHKECSARKMDEERARGLVAHSGLTDGGVCQLRADRANRTEGSSESIKHQLEDVQDGAESARQQEEPEAWMEHMLTVMLVKRTAFGEECLHAMRTRNHVVKRGHWTTQGPL